MESENESYSSGKMHEKVSSYLKRQRNCKRKDAARRYLFDSINSRKCDVGLSYSVPAISGDRIKPVVKFPRMNSKQNSTCGNGYRQYSNGDNSSSKLATSPYSYIEIIDESGQTDKQSRHHSPQNYRKTSSRSLNLPGIIMEFNLESHMVNGNSDYRVTSPPAEIIDDERALGAPYEEYLKRAGYSKFNPCRSRHRPVTPGLLESLNKLKLPTRVKTEQWVKSTQTVSKSLNGHAYRTENIDNTNLAFPNWIYTPND